MDRTRLESLLVDLADDIVFPATPDVVDPVLDRLAAPTPIPSPRRRLRPVAVAVVAVAVAVAALPGPRRAIADLLGIGGVAIVTVPELPSVATASGFSGTEVTLDAAADRADFSLFVPDGYGDPAAVFFDPEIPGGLVTIAYPAADGGYGLVVTEMEGTLDESLLQKIVGPDTTVTPVDVAGVDGFWIDGEPHLLLVLDRTGRDRVAPPRLVGTVLLFERDGVTIRIESALDLADALSVADVLETAGP